MAASGSAGSRTGFMVAASYTLSSVRASALIAIQR
jgi:hypothetical protein